MQRSCSLPKIQSQSNKDDVSTLNLKDTELTTRLTRCKFNKEATSKQHRRTLTKLEQNLVAPEIIISESGISNELSSPLRQQTTDERIRAQATKNKYRFKAQVMFESDTDSAADRQSVASSRSGVLGRTRQIQPDGKAAIKKEMITETKYSLMTRASDFNEKNVSNKISNGEPVVVEAQNGSARLIAGGRGPVPNWDYSLRVNRLRGNKIDSKVK